MHPPRTEIPATFASTRYTSPHICGVFFLDAEVVVNKIVFRSRAVCEGLEAKMGNRFNKKSVI